MAKVKSDYCVQQSKMRRGLSQEEVGRKYGFLSGLEEAISEQMDKAGISYKYEEKALPFVQPAKNRKYTPDFFLYNGDGSLASVS